MSDQNSILQQLANNLNTDPQALKNAAAKNDPAALAALLNPQQAEAFRKLLSDPKALKALLSSKQAAELQKKFNL